MNYTELLLTSFGLSMDAFSASVCRGTSLKKCTFPVCIITALFFGIFQALMPIIGYLLGNGVMSELERYDGYIAFGVLAVLGAKMVFESHRDDEVKRECDYNIGQLLLLALATSVDAMAVGFPFSAQGTEPFIPSAVIGVITFAVSAFGVGIGRKAGEKCGNGAETTGGIVLILIGVKFLLEGIK